MKYLTRQLDLIPTDKLGLSISIVGAGAVGSFTALSLAKMGFHNITVYDFDTIDPENMNCQFYRHSDIGKKKVVALQELIKDFTGFEIKVHDKKVDPKDAIVADVVISAVDNMAVRKMLYEISAFRYLIDPRMAAEYAMIQVLDPMKADSVESYKMNLYTDEEAVHERCTAKATMYTVNLIAGQVAKMVKDIALKNPYIKRLDWNIAKNGLVAFDSTGAKV